MRGVVYGILGTALAQGLLAAIGLRLAGVPAAPLLGLVTFFLSPVPVGPPRSADVDEHLEAQVDAVLEKVSLYGQDSLTESEKALLVRASEVYKRKQR